MFNLYGFSQFGLPTMMRFKLLFILCIQLALTACSPAFDSISNTSLIDSISILDDQENNLAFTDVNTPEKSANFKLLKQNNSFEIGRNSTTSWFKLSLSDKLDPQKNYILEIDRPTLDEITAFIPDKNGKWKRIQTGDNFRFSSREIPHANFLFTISGSIVNQSRNTIYLRVKNKIIASISLSLWEEAEFHEYDKIHNLFNGLYFGALLALIIFNLFIYMSVRDISYLWYVGYLGFISVFLLAYSGLAFRYFWPDFPLWADKSTFVAILVSISLGLFFCRSMLNIQEISPSLSSILYWGGFAILALLLFGFVINGTFFSKITPALALFVIVLITYSVFKSIVSGYKPAYFVALAYLFLFFGGVMFAIYKLGLVPDNLLSRYGFQFGIIVEAFLLSFALAYRIKYIDSLLKLSNQKVIDSKKLFSIKLIEAQDNERKKVAANLHDSLGQKLMVIKMQLAQFFESFNIQEDESSVKSTLGLIRETIDDIRTISHHLHPHQLERLTLKEALEDIILQSFKTSGIRVVCSLNALNDCKDKKTQLHIYRIIQESIKNILTHSNAKNVEFTASLQGKKIKLLISDDGKGIHTDWFKKGDLLKSFGLSSIKERVNSLDGTLFFISKKGNGFQIEILLSCESNGEEP